MSYKNKDKDFKKKIPLMIAGVSVLLLITTIYIYSYTSSSNEKKEKDSINNLTEVYKKDNNNKLAVIDNNGKKEITNYKVGELQFGNEKGEEDLRKKKAEDLALKFAMRFSDKNYDELYALFNEKYVNEFEFTKEKFMYRYKFDGKVSAIVTNIYDGKADDRFIATVKFTELSTGNILFIDFTIYEDGTIADIPIYKEVDINKEKTFEEVTYIVKKRYESRLGSIYSIEIKNNSDKLIDVENLLIKNNDSIKTYQIISDYKEIKSYPGIDFNVMIKLPNTDSITNLEVRYKDLDGNMKKVDIYSEK